ncbi:MAG: exodeoxyribonuclease III [Hyphomicrobiaceae bacterium]
MKIATWNINGIKARLPALLKWLETFQPDVLCLQEIKSVDVGFPREPIEDLGYNIALHGQKSFNGVAILSKTLLSDVCVGLAGDETDTQARYLEATVATDGSPIRVASIYLPNGNPVSTDKYPYKLAWMDRLIAHAETLLADELPVLLAGDYNVIPEPEDCYSPTAWQEDALFQPASRDALKTLQYLGFADAIRSCFAAPQMYTFWDYQAGAWQKNNGIRIDHILLSPQATDRLRESGIEKATRSWEKPSDHVPVWVEISDA